MPYNTVNDSIMAARIIDSDAVAVSIPPLIANFIMIRQMAIWCSTH